MYNVKISKKFGQYSIRQLFIVKLSFFIGVEICKYDVRHFFQKHNNIHECKTENSIRTFLCASFHCFCHILTEVFWQH